MAPKADLEGQGPRVWAGPEREAAGIAFVTGAAEGAGLTQTKSHPHAVGGGARAEIDRGGVLGDSPRGADLRGGAGISGRDC